MAAANADKFARLRAAGFVCPAQRLTDYDIPRIGHTIMVGEDEMHAVMDVEAAGGGFDKLKRPKMLFERHLLHRNLSGANLQRAIALGLAIPSWQPGNYPTDSYPRLAQAMSIDETAALKSASWGMGQILGSNHAAAGYPSPQAMVLAFCEIGEAEHLAAMVRFIIANKADDDLRRHDWAGFARIYNGAGYAKHGYHTKLQAAFAKWQRIPDTKWSPGMIEPAPDPMAPMVGGPVVVPTPPIIPRPIPPLADAIAGIEVPKPGPTAANDVVGRPKPTVTASTSLLGRIIARLTGKA